MMKWKKFFVCATLFCLCGNASMINAADLKIPYQFREGFLGYKEQVHSGINLAIDYLETEVEQNPDNVKARFALAQLSWMYHPKEAQQQLETILKRTPQMPEVHFFLGVIAYYQKNIEQARTHFSRAIEVDPQYPFGYNALAVVEQQTGGVAQGIAILQKGLATLGPRESFYFNLALIYAGIEEDLQAIENVQRVITLNPNDEEYNFLLGGLQLRQKDIGGARRHFQKAFELNPKNAIALLGIASTFKEEHDFEKAIELGEQAKRLAPHSKVIDEELAEYRAEYQQWKESH